MGIWSACTRLTIAAAGTGEAESMVAENVAPDAVVMPNSRPAPPLSQAWSGRPSPSTSITARTSAPAGAVSSFGAQPAGASVDGSPDGSCEGSGDEDEDCEVVADATGSAPSSSAVTRRYTMTPTAAASRT